MEHISELLAILNGYFGWNKARMSCFAKMLIALMVTRSINLKKMACFFTSDVQVLSRYRRLQRFFLNSKLTTTGLQDLFSSFFLDNGQWFLTMDRTNWKWGKECIKGILADREFIGKDWFGWLIENKLSFVIRIKNNTITTNSKGLAIDIDALFYDLKPGEQRQIEGNGRSGDMNYI